ncbi:hypothetical protein [Lyngbya aestuarii]|uniref:hypothetical protein n=1 Tax=Lyngbya aestuarii TaxID=118322 RepID=UPI00403DAEE4
MVKIREAIRQSNLRISTLLGVTVTSLLIAGISFTKFQNQSVNAQSVDLACNNQNFKSSTFGGFLSNNPFTSLDRTRQNSPNLFPEGKGWSPGNGESWGKPRYQYIAWFNNIKQWRGKICAKSVQTLANNHTISYQSSSNSSCPIGGPNYCQIYVGPKLFFETKGYDEPESKWHPLESDGKYAIYEIPANSTKVYSWAWKTSQPSDYRIRVEYAKPLDEFDFMMDKK